ncbi:hypothetical protein BBP40_010989 [Aspergillus hancockii]|nr:hypothetical protein BBP40_010989 [Aspergillus hancockii]
MSEVQARLKDFYRQLEKLFDKFRLSPILRLTDVDMRDGFWTVEGKPKCGLTICPWPQDATFTYCSEHSAAIIEYIAADKSWLPVTAKWTPLVTDETRPGISILTEWHTGRARDLWIIDFEFETLSNGASPTPIQLAIRQIDGTLLLKENVD